MEKAARLLTKSLNCPRIHNRFMKTILRTIESFYPYVSGPANQAYRLSMELEKLGIRSPILTTFFGAESAKSCEKKDGVKIYRFTITLRFMKYFWTPSMKNALDRMLERADIVHAHSYRGYQTQIAYRYARKHGKKFVLHNHGSIAGYKAFVKGSRTLPYRLYDIFFKRIILDSDAIIVNTRQEYDEVIKFGADKSKINIIPVG
ncbi:MAG: glycosyltransferase, partial [Proteobacteria bacterium]|nr:glycosyltransferase [Pseudomonadota bacterium]